MITSEPAVAEKLTTYSQIHEFNTFKDEITELQSKLAVENQEKFSYIISELNQILDSQTLERAHYYLARLIKGLTKTKTTGLNDINLNRWKEYTDIETDSLWIYDRRDRSGSHIASYWGNFIPQIPNQLLRRFTKPGEWVLDPFCGSGTTLIECRRLGRNGLGIELLDSIAHQAKNLVEKEENPNSVRTEIIVGDSRSVSIQKELNNIGAQSAQFVLLHSPYWDIIKFSQDPNDLSNARSLENFLTGFREICANAFSVLDRGRFCAVVIGDKYEKGEWIPIGFYGMEEIKKLGLKLKSTIVKNFEDTRAKQTQKQLWRYRALQGGFYVFKHEYIFLFQKL